MEDTKLFSLRSSGEHHLLMSDGTPTIARGIPDIFGSWSFTSQALIYNTIICYLVCFRRPPQASLEAVGKKFSL